MYSTCFFKSRIVYYHKHSKGGTYREEIFIANSHFSYATAYYGFG